MLTLVFAFCTSSLAAKPKQSKRQHSENVPPSAWSDPANIVEDDAELRAALDEFAFSGYVIMSVEADKAESIYELRENPAPASGCVESHGFVYHAIRIDVFSLLKSAVST